MDSRWIIGYCLYRNNKHQVIITLALERKEEPKKKENLWDFNVVWVTALNSCKNLYSSFKYF